MIDYMVDYVHQNTVFYKQDCPKNINRIGSGYCHECINCMGYDIVEGYILCAIKSEIEKLLLGVTK